MLSPLPNIPTIASWVITPNVPQDNASVAATFTKKTLIDGVNFQFKFLFDLGTGFCPVNVNAAYYDVNASNVILNNGLLSSYTDVVSGNCATYYGQIIRLSDNTVIQQVSGNFDNI